MSAAPLASERFAIRGLGVLTGPSGAGADLALLPRTLRRGLSEVMKLGVAAAGRALGADRGAGELPIVFGSAFGETSTALELLGQITSQGSASPALFRHSVHNAAPGLLSIALGSGAPATAVGAGDETLLAVLLEAAALLREGSPEVLAIVAEEVVPPVFLRGRSYRTGAVAWLLAPAAATAAALGYLTAPELGGAGDLAAGSRDPLAPAFALAEAITRQQPATVALSTRRPWRVRAAAAAEALA